MSKLQTIVILTPAFPENESATHWVPSQQLLVKALRKNSPSIQIIVLSFLYPYTESRYKWNGVNVTSFNGMKKTKLKRVGLWSSVWRTLQKINRENEVIGMISFWCGECALVGKYFSRLNGIKHFCWISGQDARKENKYVKFIRPKSDELIAMSEFLKTEFHKNHGVNPKHLIENGIDPELFPAFNDQRDIDLLGVGSFEPLKQYDLFTEIVATVRNQIPAINAVHCGIGRERENIQSLIRKFRLENNFHLLGGKLHEEVLALMQRTKVFLHPSNYEGFSTVCLEALYGGAHVISFTKAMNHDINHWHIVQSKEEMTAKCLELLQNKNLSHDRVLVSTMEDSAKKFMKLLNQNRTNENR